MSAEFRFGKALPPLDTQPPVVVVEVASYADDSVAAAFVLEDWQVAEVRPQPASLER